MDHRDEVGPAGVTLLTLEFKPELFEDMDVAAVNLRPIIDLSGHENEYNEVFFDEVRIPADRLLGKEGDGWRIATSQLQTERVALSKPGAIWGSGPTARDLIYGLIATEREQDRSFTPGLRSACTVLVDPRAESCTRSSERG